MTQGKRQHAEIVVFKTRIKGRELCVWGALSHTGAWALVLVEEHSGPNVHWLAGGRRGIAELSVFLAAFVLLLAGLGAGRAAAQVVNGDFAAGGASLRFGAGYAPLDGLALAVGIDASVAGGEVIRSDGTDSGLGAWSIGPLVDWYPNAQGPLHVDLAVGYAVAGFMSGSRNGGGGGGTSDGGLGGAGIGGHTGVGYTFRSGGVGLGPMLSVSALHTENSHATLNAFGAALLIQGVVL